MLGHLLEAAGSCSPAARITHLCVGPAALKNRVKLTRGCIPRLGSALTELMPVYATNGSDLARS